MTKSSLCTYTRLTSQRSSGRGGNRVCKITPHYMAAYWTGKQCADYFATCGREASSNYCIGYDGDIAMSVDEDNRAWTSSSAWNDNRAITIECANNADSSLTGATWNALVDLCVDICRRYGFTLEYDGAKNGSLTEHRMFASTECPGAWLHARMGKLASEVNARLAGGSSASSAGGSSGGSASSAQEGTGFGGTYACNASAGSNVRTAPSLSGAVVASYSKGQTVVLDDWYTSADGYIWGRYTGATSGQKRYVAVGKATGKVEPDDIWVKQGGSASSFKPHKVKVTTGALNIRKGPGTGYGVAGCIRDYGTYTIVAESAGAGASKWGKLKSGAGWISLDYCKRV